MIASTSSTWCRLTTVQLQKKAAEWDVPAEQLGDVRWGYWDWEDRDHDEATGSRIRLWFPAIMVRWTVLPCQIRRQQAAFVGNGNWPPLSSRS